MSFTLAAREARALQGSSVVLDARVENRSGRAISLPNPLHAHSPQPFFRLTRPDGAEATFTPAGDREGPLAMVTLQHDEAWEGELDVSSLTDLTAPGRYTLQARLAWGAVDVTSGEVTFEVSSARWSGLVASLSRSDQGDVVREVLLALRGDTGAELCAVKLREESPRLAEMVSGDVIPRGALPEALAEVAGPYANYATGLDPLRWRVARDATGVVHVGNDLAPTLLPLPSALPVHQLLTPLASQGERLAVLALASDGTRSELVLASVHTEDDEPRSPGFVSLFDLGVWPAAAAAALGPESAGSPLVVTLAFHLPHGTRCVALTLESDGRVLAQGTHEVPGVWAERVMGAWRADDGCVRCGFLARGPAEGADAPLHLVDVEFDARLEAARAAPGGGALGLSITQAREAQVVYFQRPGEPVERLAWVRLHSGEAFVVHDAKGLRAWRAPVDPSSPVAFVPGRDRWYAVHHDRAGKVQADGV